MEGSLGAQPSWTSFLKRRSLNLILKVLGHRVVMTPTDPGSTEFLTFPLNAYMREFEDDPHVLLMYNSITYCTSSSLAKPLVCLRPA